MKLELSFARACYFATIVAGSLALGILIGGLAQYLCPVAVTLVSILCLSGSQPDMNKEVALVVLFLLGLAGIWMVSSFVPSVILLTAFSVYALTQL